MSTSLVNVAMAILHQDGKFLMQLRDDFPHIIYPGCWGFFGGHLEPGEDADTSIKRELLEEIGHCPSTLLRFDQQSDETTRRYYYYGELMIPIGDLQLNEGQDLGLCSPEEIRAGEKFSEKLGEVRLLGKPHQALLLKFLAGDVIA